MTLDSLDTVKLHLYIFSFQENWKFFNHDSNTLLHDCSKPESNEFFNDLITLDKMAFGDQGMGMDKWVLYDCAAMPGAITGYAIEKKQYIEQYPFLEKFNGEFVPISMFIAIPMLGDRTWFAHNLSSIGSHLKLKGLGVQTKASGIRVLKINKLFGATQWGSPAIHIHSQLADMIIVSSTTVNHTHQNSFTYKSVYSDDFQCPVPRRVSSDHDFLLSESDLEKHRSLQKDIEAKKKVIICGRPVVIDGITHYPMTRK